MISSIQSGFRYPCFSNLVFILAKPLEVRRSETIFNWFLYYNPQNRTPKDDDEPCQVECISMVTNEEVESSSEERSRRLCCYSGGGAVVELVLLHRSLDHWTRRLASFWDLWGWPKTPAICHSCPFFNRPKAYHHHHKSTTTTGSSRQPSWPFLCVNEYSKTSYTQKAIKTMKRNGLELI